MSHPYDHVLQLSAHATQLTFSREPARNIEWGKCHTWRSDHPLSVVSSNVSSLLSKQCYNFRELSKNETSLLAWFSDSGPYVPLWFVLFRPTIVTLFSIVLFLGDSTAFTSSKARELACSRSILGKKSNKKRHAPCFCIEATSLLAGLGSRDKCSLRRVFFGVCAPVCGNK